MEFGTLMGNSSNEAFERDFRLIHAVDKSQLVQNGDPNGTYVVFKGTIQQIRQENCTYLVRSSSLSSLSFLLQACNQCRKKLTLEGDQYRCERCGPTQQPRVLYKLNVQVSDFSGSVWISFFDETATKLTGLDAAEFKELSETDVSSSTDYPPF